MSDFISPVARLVQGSLSLENKIDQQTNKPKLDEHGNPIKECFIAIAIRKDDPGLPGFMAQLAAQARADFPQLFDANGNCTHPQFSWKVQDGDGHDQSGQSVANKPGFAGHMVIKMATRYMPKCFHANKYDPSQQIQNPSEVIKRGYYVRVAGTFRGNGVAPGTTAKPGMYISPNLVELVAYGEEIQTGPDASKVFGGAAAPTLPPGASATPMAGSTLAPPPMPGAAPAPMGTPPLPGATLAPPPMPGAMAMPPLPAAPQYIMQPSAQGATREALLAAGWTDEMLIQQGHMVKVG